MILYLLPIMVSAVGAYLLFKLRFFFILHPVRTLKFTFLGIKSHNARSSLSLALAGTLGVGNIFGVASGIIIGGVGSVFWLFVCTAFCAVIKYAEVTLTHDNIRRGEALHGGMAYCIRAVLGKWGAPLSVVYAVLTLALSLVMGAGLQCGTLVEGVAEISPRAPIFISSAFALLVIFAITGGGGKIEKITSFLIPLSTIIYIIMTLTMIFLNFHNLPSVINSIIRDAFKPLSTLGGGISFAFLLPIKEGYCRGVLSNEAGSGTSGMAHAKSGMMNPAHAGLMGIAEVNFDTAIMCMLTALAILVSVPNPGEYTSPMALLISAFSYNFGFSSVCILMGLIFIFAYSTVICWYYYAIESLGFLGADGYRGRFFAFYIGAVALLPLFGNSYLLFLSDMILLFMSLLTMLVLIKSSDRIKHLSESGGIISRYLPPVLNFKSKKSDS